MTTWKDWKNADAQFGIDYAARLDDLTPEPLFESFLIPGPKVCLRCAQAQATSLLYSPNGVRPVLPLCLTCAADWNAYGYRILNGLRAKTLMWRLTVFKLKHPFSRPSILEITADVQNLVRWVRKMKRLQDQAN
jgi:hypothetical protein